MTETQIYLHSHVAEHLQKLGDKKEILQYIDRLVSNPETVGDYRQADPRGRMIEVKIIGRHALLFFKDPFAGMAKIIDLRNVESL